MKALNIWAKLILNRAQLQIHCEKGLYVRTEPGGLSSELKQLVSSHKDELTQIAYKYPDGANPWIQGKALNLIFDTYAYTEGRHDAIEYQVFSMEAQAAFKARDMKELKSICAWFIDSTIQRQSNPENKYDRLTFTKEAHNN